MLNIIFICGLTLFLAELVDKSQLIIFSFSIKYGLKNILLAFSLAAILNQSLFILIGHNLGKFLSPDTAKIITAICLLIFAYKIFFDTFTKVQSSEQTQNKIPHKKDKDKQINIKIIFTIVISIFIAELGDLTMFATISFATKYNWAYVLIGSSLGIILANIIAVVGADIISKYLKEKLLNIIAGAIFIIYGSILLFQFISTKTNSIIASLVILSLIAAFSSTIKLISNNKQKNAEKTLVR